MSVDPFFILGGRMPPKVPSDVLHARWARLSQDFSRLPRLSIEPRSPARVLRDVGELLLLGHDDALADAERYVYEGHTSRTGHLVEYDDIEDEEALDRWAAELDRASSEGWAPPAPEGFWSSFLHWRTPLGMARLSERRLRRAPPI